MTELRTVPVERLREGLRGQVLAPADDGYDEARRVWNGLIEASPAVVARCTGVADVLRALDFARGDDLEIAVRSGGHSVQGFSTCDGGVVIDLGAMRGITVDPRSRVARAQAGATLGAFDHETQQFGLATTLGVMSGVGIMGLTLGGGFGWLMRRHGLASDNVVAADVVTADGQFLTASADENSDLFWALRGGGGNFGIVTSLSYRLHPVGPVVMGGLVAYAPPATRDVLRFYRDLTASAPDELTAYAALTAAPDGSRIAALAACYAGAVEDGERALRGANRVTTPVLDNLGPLPYVVQQSMMDDAYARGRYYYWGSCFLDELTDEIIDILAEAAPTEPAPTQLALAVEHLDGAVSAAGEDATAFGHRTARYDILIDASWNDPADTERCIAWARSVRAALAPHSRDTGYVNYDPDEGAAAAAYGARYARLQDIKRRYDPENVFRRNQNIAPQGVQS
jgi:FAD/FMN-containing dehydrogenase